MTASTLYLHQPRIRAAVRTLLSCEAMRGHVRWGTSNGVETVSPEFTADYYSTGQQALWRVAESLVHGELREACETDADSRMAVAAAVTVLLVPAEERAL